MIRTIAPLLRRTAVILTAALAPTLAGAQTLPGVTVWPEASADPREFSGIEIVSGGRELFAVSDRGLLIRASIQRDAQGDIAGISAPEIGRLQPVDGSDGPVDAEGIAVLRDGRLAVSFENPHRIAIYNRNGTPSSAITSPGFFGAYPVETGPEAIEAAPDGSLLVAMEGIPRGATHIPIYRYAGGTWGQIQGPVVDGRYVPVGLDTDDRGRVYLLERDYRRPASFSSRLRRFTISGGIAVNVETLVQTPQGAYGNFEGVSVWRAADGGLRATLVADDNGTRLLQRGLAEFRLPN